VDKNTLIRKGIFYLLSKEENITEIHEASNITEAKTLLIENAPEITIMELYLGKESGFEIISWAKINKLPTKFLVFTSSINQYDFEKSKQLNVDGYLSKKSFPEDLLYAFHVIVRGNKFFHNEIVNNNYEIEIDKITKREKEILIKIGEGYTNKQIAKELFISVNTVKKHIGSIFSKLDKSSRTEVAIYIRKHN